MTRYLINRILRSLLSVVIVVAVVMVMIYMCLDKQMIFKTDPTWTHMKANAQDVYEMQQWERFGYLDYIPYAEYMLDLYKKGELTEEQYSTYAKLGKDASKDSPETTAYIAKFTEYYESRGYKVERLAGITQGNTNRYKDGGEPRLYAYRNTPIWTRLGEYFKNLITVDNIHNASGDVGKRGISFTLHDPAYGGEKFSPAIMGNGTTHKYLLYCNDQFPYIHQNLVQINLGESYAINMGVDVFQTMTQAQGSQRYCTVTYPTGLTEMTADNIHTAKYVEGSLNEKNPVAIARYTDDYTNTTVRRTGLSKTGYSFIIGIISVALAYVLAIPLGVLMALKKDKLIDKLGTLYIVFVMAVPSLAYIFMFKAIGEATKLPTTFDMQNPTWLMYILPVISLALPSVANLMKWLRRYMIDQMNSDYVKFARSGGLSEGEIFSKHVLKNAIIPVVHGIPGSVLGAMVGAIITERVYVVPGAGNLLTNAINAYDNGVIVGLTMFYAILTITSTILGDILMSIMDPRISLTTKKAR